MRIVLKIPHSRSSAESKADKINAMEIKIKAHCLDLDLNDKRPGATSDNGFIFRKLNEN